MFQALGVPDRTPAVHPTVYHPLGQGVRAPALEQLGSSSAPQPQAAPGAAPPPPPLILPLCPLRVMGIRLPNRQPPVGFRLALLPHVPLVTPVLH